MKLRSLAEFEAAVDNETAWRKRELTTILFQSRAARPRLQPTALRSAVALLYAHWEGWIKALASYYIDHVDQQRLRYDQLSAPFLAIGLKGRMTTLADAKAAAAQIDFAKFVQDELGTQARLPSAGMVRTESNLSSKALRDIVTRLGLNFDAYELQANLIDKLLVERRNHIAHGEYLDVDITAYQSLHDEVLLMLRTFTSDVLNAAALRQFRLAAP